MLHREYGVPDDEQCTLLVIIVDNGPLMRPRLRQPIIDNYILTLDFRKLDLKSH